MMEAMKDGATAANRPVTAKPAKAASAAMTNIERTSLGTDSGCTRIRPERLEVSGTSSTTPAARITSTIWTRNDSRSGSGAY